MNADGLAVIADALVAAIAQAKTRARTFGIDPDFREIVRQVREVRDLVIEGLSENQSLSTAYLRSLIDTTGKEIDHLEALVRMPDGEVASLPRSRSDIHPT
jgi:hypothetical protein